MDPARQRFYCTLIYGTICSVKSMSKENSTTRPPVIAVMGHIDHGKSTLLDYIRKSNTAASEAGGITQHLSAYEITHEGEEGSTKMTFLDTPGHEAFIAMRERGATVADIGVLVVAADDGVQEQTKETIKEIKEQEIPFIVAINKIDKPEADVDAVIQELAESEVYVEGFGGDISYVEISAKTGENIEELLDLLTLTAKLNELTTDPQTNASGTVIESSVDAQRGTQATLVITDGSLETGMYVHAEGCIAPVRIFENFKGKSIEKAQASTPVLVVGFDEQPKVGAKFESLKDKKAAREAAEQYKKSKERSGSQGARQSYDAFTIPVVVKTDVSGTVDAITHELKKLHSDRAALDIVHTGVGDITEDDIRAVASNDVSSIVVGFNVSVSQAAKQTAKRRDVAVKTGSVIYELVEWLKEAVEERTPTITTRVVRGRAKVLKTFSSKKDMQVIGGKVFDGTITSSAGVSVIRNETKIADGEIVELQQQRAATDKVESGHEFGANIESRVTIAPGDVIESFEMVES